ncbi:MAG: Inner membrane protein, KefB/KefC family, partial [uncultured Solirubrobacteraceae bacterium]
VDLGSRGDSGDPSPADRPGGGGRGGGLLRVPPQDRSHRRLPPDGRGDRPQRTRPRAGSRGRRCRGRDRCPPPALHHRARVQPRPAQGAPPPAADRRWPAGAARHRPGLRAAPPGGRAGQRRPLHGPPGLALLYGDRSEGARRPRRGLLAARAHGRRGPALPGSRGGRHGPARPDAGALGRLGAGHRAGAGHRRRSRRPHPRAGAARRAAGARAGRAHLFAGALPAHGDRHLPGDRLRDLAGRRVGVARCLPGRPAGVRVALQLAGAGRDPAAADHLQRGLLRLGRDAARPRLPGGAPASGPRRRRRRARPQGRLRLDRPARVARAAGRGDRGGAGPRAGRRVLLRPGPGGRCRGPDARRARHGRHPEPDRRDRAPAGRHAGAGGTRRTRTPEAHAVASGSGVRPASGAAPGSRGRRAPVRPCRGRRLRALGARRDARADRARRPPGRDDAESRRCRGRPCSGSPRPARRPRTRPDPDRSGTLTRPRRGRARRRRRTSRPAREGDQGHATGRDGHRPRSLRGRRTRVAGGRRRRGRHRGDRGQRDPRGARPRALWARGRGDGRRRPRRALLLRRRPLRRRRRCRRDARWQRRGA